MRIIQIGKRYFPYIGGIEQTTQDIATVLKDKCEQRVICYNHEKGNKIEKIEGVDVIRVGCFATVASQPVSLGYKKLLKKQFKEFAPDVVIFHYPNPFAAHYLLKVLKKYPECKLIIWWHTDIVKQKILAKFFNNQNKKLLKRASKVVATSPIYVQNSQNLIKYKDICTVIPSCVNENRLTITEDIEEKCRKISKDNEGKTICFALGRHVEYKGFEYLIRASSLLDNNFKIYIGGDGKLTEELKDLAKNDNKIEFLGKLTDSDMKAYMTACDIYCFPSITKNEAFGLALAEAMYYGKPSVTFTIEGSGVNYVSLNGVTGLEVENRNVEEYADAIKKLSKDVELRNKFGDAARKRVEELFTLKAFKENVIELLNISK